MVWYNRTIQFQLYQTLLKAMTSHTETTQTITETINSMDYNTGYQYSATGSGVKVNGTLSPGTGSVNVNINGVTSSWTGVTSNHNFLKRQ